jgi:DNA-binding MarR family transcriptional regulator
MVKIDLVRRPTLVTPRHLLRYVFATEMQVEQAAKILNVIMSSDGVLPASEWEQFVLSSRGLYVKVIRKMRDAGLVEKSMGEYRIARDFSSSLTKIGKYWADIVDSYSDGDRTIAF